MGEMNVSSPSESTAMGKCDRKATECDITAELDSCKKMMAYLASEEGDGHDVQLLLNDGTEIPAHSFILRLRSDKLRLKIDEEKNKGSSKPYPVVIDEDVDKEDFTVFVRFLYLYEVCKELTPKLRRSLILLARNYMVVGLEDYCRDFLKENISSSNVLLFLEEAIQQNFANTIGQIQQECLDIISVDHTVFRAENASLRDTTPRILHRIVGLSKLPVSEEGLFLFLLKWKEYQRLEKDDPELIEILKSVRFPTMRGQFLADVVQPTGMVPMDALAEYPCTPREVTSLLYVRTSQFGCFSIEFSGKDNEERLRRKINRVAGIDSQVYKLYFNGNLLCSQSILSDIGIKSDDTIEMVSLLNITIKAASGQSWTFDVFDNDSIGALKREFAKVIGSDASKMIFRLDTKQGEKPLLHDKESIAKSKLSNGAVISFTRNGKRIYGANVCDQGKGTAISSSNFCPAVTKAMNGFKTSKDSWSSSKGQWNEPQWLVYVFKDTKMVTKLSFLGATKASDSPVSYQLQGSNEGQNWLNIFEVEKGPLFNSSREPRCHEFENGRAFKYYRLNITQVQWARISASQSTNNSHPRLGFVAVSSLQLFEARQK